MSQIFISYARADTEFARRLSRELRRFKVQGFMDQTDLAAGARLSDQLRDAVTRADAVVAVLSPEAARSSWVLAEIGLAQSANKEILPVLAPGAPYDESVPGDLTDRIVVDANSTPIEQVAARIVASATNTSVDVALQSVASQARRRARVAAMVGLTMAALAVLSLFAAMEASKQRDIAETTRDRLAALLNEGAGLAIAPDGRMVASSTENGAILVWDLESGIERVRFQLDSGGISCMAFSPDGRRLASASWDGEISLWDMSAASVSLVLRGHEDTVVSLAFSPDGSHLFSRSLDGTIREWSTTDGGEVRILSVPKQE